MSFFVNLNSTLHGYSVKIKALVLPVWNLEVRPIHLIHIKQQMIIHVVDDINSTCSIKCIYNISSKSHT